MAIADLLCRVASLTAVEMQERDTEGEEGDNTETNNGKSVSGGKGGSPRLTPTLSFTPPIPLSPFFFSPFSPPTHSQTIPFFSS